MTQATIVWEFELYIVGHNPKSELTYHNLNEICERYLANKCVINVIDLKKNPKIAAEKQIMAIPTVIRKKPAPERVLIGDLSNTARVVEKFGLKGFQLEGKGAFVSLKENQPFSPKTRLINCKMTFFNLGVKWQ